MLLLLLACASPSVVDTDADVPADVCDAESDAPIAPLPDRPTWESAEREYGTGLAWADVNGDGRRDLVVASGNDMRPGPLSVHLGDADGLDPVPTVVAAADYRGHLAAGDVDGDGYDDVVSTRFLGEAGFDEPGGIDLYRGGPAGLDPAPAWTADGFYTFAAALGDIDGDGDLDLAVAVGESYEHDPWPQRLYRNEGGDFGAEPAWTSADLAHAFDVGFVDWEPDGDMDLVYARSGAPHAVYATEGGSPGALPVWQASGAGWEGNTLDLGDVDGDGRDDLLVSDNSQLGGAGVVRLYCGDGWASCWESGGPEMWSAVSLQDLDGDGDLDAVAGAWWGPVTSWRNDGGALVDRLDSDTVSVIEAFGWHDLDGSHVETGCASGVGLIRLPKGARVTSSSGPVASGDGWASAPAQVELVWERSRQPDLAVTNWDPDLGTWLFAR